VFNKGALGFIEFEQNSTGFLDFGTELKNPVHSDNAFAKGSRRTITLKFARLMDAPPTAGLGPTAHVAAGDEMKPPDPSASKLRVSSTHA
jgi:hypothetical protein